MKSHQSNGLKCYASVFFINSPKQASLEPNPKEGDKDDGIDS